MLWVMAVSWVYWIFLYIYSSPLMDHDPRSFDYIGRIIYEKGWWEFFRTGPHREPMLPGVIAAALHLCAGKAVYLKIVTFFHLILLSCTQILLDQWLRILSVRPWIRKLALLYFAFSPAVVNSALSLFSEVYTFPLLMALLVLIARWFKAPPTSKSVVTALGVGLVGLALVLTKGVFEIIIPVFLGVVGIYFLCRQWKRQAAGVLLAVIIFLGGVMCFKWGNYQGNHDFTVTNRSPGMVYGAARRRGEAMDTKTWLKGFALIPWDIDCESRFPKSECKFWSFMTTDAYGFKRFMDLGRTFYYPIPQLNRLMYQEAFTFMLDNPRGYIGGFLQEGVKMFFWESSRAECVYYDLPFLEKFFKAERRFVGLRVVMGFLSVLGLAGIFLVRKKGMSQDEQGLLFVQGLLMLLIIFSYAFVTVLTRYAFCLIPFFLSAIAFMTRFYYKDKGERI